ncbi:GLPGLI family protein [Riemerella anatipestifer]|nr:GLPGLI family protein [Riemerella anatipestifer]MBT0535414.1 GLPGLI family protein [Riemerella anatipestifer]MBT0539361.1 GLPGLI family protein [Riemerella anatipestifer]MBT0543190.1 GLPGLI family protein [Riemerella anatipestifer]MBT0545160.1 GLPGLI family protein [Riemerella anatipestifer]
MRSVIKFCVIFFGLLVVNIAYSQVATVSGNLNFSPEPFIQKEIDRVRYQVFYELKFLLNADQPSSFREAVTILQIGDNFVKFADANTYKSDSLRNEFQYLKSIRTKEFNQLLALRPKFPYTIYSNPKENVYTLNNELSHYYTYTAPIPKLEWKISSTTKKIGDYLAVKATTRYSGRNYEAWFTQEIPFSYGPYLFQGLPGLILEIRDTANHYAFTLFKIEKLDTVMTKGSGKEVLEVTREKYKKLERVYHENPGQFIDGTAYDAGGNPINFRKKPRPYNPIELE